MIVNKRLRTVRELWGEVPGLEWYIDNNMSAPHDIDGFRAGHTREYSAREAYYRTKHQEWCVVGESGFVSNLEDAKDKHRRAWRRRYL